MGFETSALSISFSDLIAMGCIRDNPVATALCIRHRYESMNTVNSGKHLMLFLILEETYYGALKKYLRLCDYASRKHNVCNVELI